MRKIWKQFLGLCAYITDRKILLVAIAYIIFHILFLLYSWIGVSALVGILVFALIRKPNILFILIFVALLCCTRNYYDINVEKNIKDYVNGNYLNQNVELEGYVYIEPAYKHEYARVVFLIEGKESFLVQGNTARFPRLSVGQVCKISGQLVEPENFEAFNYKDYLRNRRIYYLMRYPDLECSEERRGFYLKNVLMDFKSYVRGVVESKLPEPQVSLFLGVLFGERRVFEDSFQDALRVASITHIIVASGYNVSIIYLGINKVFFFLPKRSRTLLSIFLIWIYCALVGFTPSIIRASLMLSLTLIAVYYGTVSNINIVFLTSAFLFIFLDPRIISDFGFLLSISATGGLIYITPILDLWLEKFLAIIVPLEDLRKYIYKFLQNYFIPSLACTIITMPLIAFTFQKISIIGVLTNVMILPVLEYTLILGFFTLFLNYFFPIFTDFLFLTIWVHLKYFELVVEFLGNLKYASYEVNINVLVVVLIYLILLFLISLLSPSDGRNYYLNLQENC
jgi:competence protein ComEC